MTSAKHSCPDPHSEQTLDPEMRAPNRSKKQDSQLKERAYCGFHSYMTDLATIKFLSRATKGLVTPDQKNK